MGKKKKRAESEAEAQPEENKVDIVNGDSHQKDKKKKKHKFDGPAVIPSVSIAVPGSIIDNTQSLELATRLASQIARAATIFRIDERFLTAKSASVYVWWRNLEVLVAQRTLSGEVPVKCFFRSTSEVVIFDNKSESGSLPQADSDENESGAAFLVRILMYLETPQYLRKALFPKHNSLRFVGMLPPLDAPHHLRKHEWGPFREGVTLKERPPNLVGTLVDVGLSKGGYDHSIGTSEHGQIINSSELTVPTFRHLLIAFGGLAGLEESVEEDANLKAKNVREVFDLYLNTCPHQGSRTIRTEEAILISLQYFQEPISRALKRI
ncbi:hypothetical protein C1H46_016828 [Malus baccata]|uniref:Uncharacterized protein n=1 Tax=Malus baccata TaxID=106549 RepID=A0A540MFN3_MALBA|nr:hypothetical protein C1H46_016828 [Malus baccata]